jgi:N-acetylglucosamine kinase-like BadF-type ATPase
MRYVLGVDGGGSKVACLAADERGKLLGYGRGGPVNTNYVSRREAMDALRCALDTALTTAGLRAQQIEALCMSAMMSPDTVEKATGEYNIRQVVRAAEAEAARWATRFWVDGRIGVMVGAGTGSVARGWAGDGRRIGSGGWGSTLGDAGSALWIGIRAMVSVLEAFDGRTRETLLSRPVLDHFGMSDVYEMVSRVSSGFKTKEKLAEEIAAGHPGGFTIDSGQAIHQAAAIDRAGRCLDREASLGGLLFRHQEPQKGPLARHEVASLCPIVVRAAQQGDWKAIEILRLAGYELARPALAVVQRLGMEGDEFLIATFGGVFRAGDLVIGSFKEGIKGAVPRAKVVGAKFEPEVGAVLLALSHIGVTVHDHMTDAVEQSSIDFPASRVC